uniref:Uncharacterized protein n=1 Tax=Solanum tuberosum TaxID=4113 RepID=M1DAT7_SOLTU
MAITPSSGGLRCTSRHIGNLLELSFQRRRVFATSSSYERLVGVNQILVSLEKLEFTLGLGEKRKEKKGEDEARFIDFVKDSLWISPRIQSYEVCILSFGGTMDTLAQNGTKEAEKNEEAEA